MRITILLIAAFLSGCGGMGYLADSYGTMSPTTVQTSSDSYWVYDKPSEGKILVQRNPLSAAGQGLVGGLLLNPSIAAAPKPYYQQAAEQHLSATGRQCRIKDGYLVIEPSWEFTYDCEPQSVVTSSLPAAR
jgi:hypothetical protein